MRRARSAAGSRSCRVHRTGSPALAAQPAAGIAYSGRARRARSPRAALGSPAAAVCSRSIACGERGRVGAGDVGRLLAVGRGASCRSGSPARRRPSAPRSAPARPARTSWRRACRSPSESSIGARSGRLNSWAAEIAARQSFASASDDRGGRACRASVDGIHGLRDARGVGDRVGARHARRVLGREDREAERLGGVALVRRSGRSPAGLLAWSSLPLRRRSRPANATSASRRISGRRDTTGDTLAVVQVGVSPRAGIRRVGRTVLKSAGKVDDHRLDITRHRAYKVPRQRRAPGVMPGGGGPRLCGANQRLERREAQSSFSASPSANPAGRRKRSFNGFVLPTGACALSYSHCCFASLPLRARSPMPPTGGASYTPPPPPAADPSTVPLVAAQPLVPGAMAVLLPDGTAAAPADAPAAGAERDLGREHDPDLPYRYGGGHKPSVDAAATTAPAPSPTRCNAAACSKRPLDSSSFMHWGAEGPGPVVHGLHEPRPRLRGDRGPAARHQRGRRRRRQGPALARQGPPDGGLQRAPPARLLDRPSSRGQGRGARLAGGAPTPAFRRRGSRRARRGGCGGASAPRARAAARPSVSATSAGTRRGRPCVVERPPSSGRRC